MNTSYKHLNIDEREKIMVLLSLGKSIGIIAKQLDRAKSTICREIKFQWCVVRTLRTDILHKQGLGDVVSKLHDPQTEQTLLARINFGQQLTQRLGVSGVPQLVLERDGRFEVAPSQLLFGDESGLLNIWECGN